MISKIITPSMKKLKEWKKQYPTIARYLTFGALGAVIVFCITISNQCEKRRITNSYKDSILQEINFDRNKLDYTLAQRQQKVRNRPTLSLEHSVHVSESFADNLSLKNDLITLYQSLSSAQKSAEELMSLLSQNKSNPITIQNRENDIKRTIELADKIGPRAAKYIGKSWDVPPANMAEKERIKYYETQTTIITSAATDNAVKFK